MAYYCEIHPGIISEAMGHSSIIVTETYLKPFKNKKIDEANVTINVRFCLDVLRNMLIFAASFLPVTYKVTALLISYFFPPLYFFS